MNIFNRSNEEKEAKDWTLHYVKPHDVKSREVTQDDLKRVLEDAHIMYQLCWTKLFHYQGALAIAHQQICNKDPLRFFVTADKKIIVNPVITNHTKVPVVKDEGCMSFPDKFPVKVERYHKITVSYQEINEDGEIKTRENVGLSGKDAQMFQHEMSHFDCDYIYNLK